MKKSISNICLEHKKFWLNNKILLLEGVLFFIFALIIQHFAYNYVDFHVTGTSVGDLLLDNLPSLDLDFFIVQGALIVSFIIIILMAVKPKYILFSIKTFALYIIVRSFFFSLTHLGANLHQITLDTDSIGFGLYNFLFNSKNDFFFSAHTGTPFLFALIFYNEKVWRYFFFTVSFILGASMILAHMHYSIDVFAAPFITYGIFVIAKKVFKRDFELAEGTEIV